MILSSICDIIYVSSLLQKRLLSLMYDHKNMSEFTMKMGLGLSQVMGIYYDYVKCEKHINICIGASA